MEIKTNLGSSLKIGDCVDTSNKNKVGASGELLNRKPLLGLREQKHYESILEGISGAAVVFSLHDCWPTPLHHGSNEV